MYLSDLVGKKIVLFELTDINSLFRVVFEDGIELVLTCSGVGSINRDKSDCNVVCGSFLIDVREEPIETGATNYTFITNSGQFNIEWNCESSEIDVYVSNSPIERK